MTITLPDDIRAKAEAKAREGGFASVDQYVAYLVLTHDPGEDLSPPSPSVRPRTRQELEQMIVDGLNSGPPVLADDAFWDDLERRAVERRATRTRRPA